MCVEYGSLLMHRSGMKIALEGGESTMVKSIMEFDTHIKS